MDKMFSIEGKQPLLYQMGPVKKGSLPLRAKKGSLERQQQVGKTGLAKARPRAGIQILVQEASITVKFILCI